MIPILYRYVGGALIFFLLLGGVYLKGRSNGADSVQVKFDRYKETTQLAYDRQVAKTAEIQAQWDATKESESEIQSRLADATARGVDLANRLRAYARSRPLSPSAGPTPVADGTGGVGSDSGGFSDRVGTALEKHLSACSRDGARLNSWIEFYRSLQDAQ